MDKTLFKNLIIVLDKEIDAYCGLKTLFENKRDLLKKAKSDDLGVLDSKILAANETIKRFNKERINISERILHKEANMSEFIALAEKEAPEFVENLSEKKEKICKLINDLTSLNNSNIELINHGMILTNKMLETIVDAFAPKCSKYNGGGKVDNGDMDMWTVNEEV